MAAERLAAAGCKVTVHERMPSAARKFLMAGRGGLNLTHSEPLPGLLKRYGAAEETLAPMIETFGPGDLTAWAQGLGQETFVGSSGRVFPKAMKASPLLRAWLGRLNELGVQVRTRSTWEGWTDDGALAFSDGAERPDATILALGGASWPRLGSDGGWTHWLEARGVEVAPFQPSNVGFDVAWSEILKDRFAGQPLKSAAFTHGDRTVRGEAMIARYGIEGGAIYALSADLRDAIQRDGKAVLTVDLRPDLSIEALAGKLAKARGKDSVSNWLRKAGLSPVAIAMLREVPGEVPANPDKLARRIKALRMTLIGAQGLERAISSAGGIGLDQVDGRLMLKALPGVFVAGEMLDWEAPTGGYLLQACFASGVTAANGALAWLAAKA